MSDEPLVALQLAALVPMLPVVVRVVVSNEPLLTKFACADNANVARITKGKPKLTDFCRRGLCIILHSPFFPCDIEVVVVDCLAARIVRDWNCIIPSS